jgi:hypothetical protein
MAGAIDPLGQRKNALDAFLETKVAAGFRIETHTDTHAIIIVGGHRKPLWSRFRKHGAGSRSRGVGRRARRGDDDPRRAEAKLDSKPGGGHDLLTRRREFVLQLGEAVARHVLQLSRNVEEHLSLVTGNANCPHACM